LTPTKVFHAAGEQKCFVAVTIGLAFVPGLHPDDLFDIAARHSLHFDQTKQIRIVFHM
jgi:hypothetical protein